MFRAYLRKPGAPATIGQFGTAGVGTDPASPRLLAGLVLPGTSYVSESLTPGLTGDQRLTRTMPLPPPHCEVADRRPLRRGVRADWPQGCRSSESRGTRPNRCLQGFLF
jgi:hypothetical protein